MKDAKEEMHHFIAKLHFIPDKKGYSILSFDDITELNLLDIFDKKQSSKDSKEKQQKAIFDLLEVVSRNSSKVKLHNYYKGLSITQDGIITSVGEDFVEVKSLTTQQKAVLYENKTIIDSEAFPKPILCKKVLLNSFEKQIMRFGEMEFAKDSPITRGSIRVQPNEEHTVTLLINGLKFLDDIRVVDISIDAIRIFSNIKPEYEEGDKLRVDILFSIEKQKLIINSEIKFYKIHKVPRGYETVYLFELDAKNKQLLTTYIFKRQMQLIREFKGL
jgi:hypothetical protein